MSQINYIHLPEATSTNTALGTLADQLPHATVLFTDCQTAGRGQRGNSWEASPGLNITMSALIKPSNFLANSQFALSEIVALATADLVESLLPPSSNVKIKWPNDIYVGDKKIAGILLENSLSGYNLRHSIAGIGVNINQPLFLSNAPNPVSIFQLTGAETSVKEAIESLSTRIFSLFDQFIATNRLADLHTLFLTRLWRADGRLHPFRIAETGKLIQARIHSVDPLGPLILDIHPDGTLHHFAFKEIAYIL